MQARTRADQRAYDAVTMNPTIAAKIAISMRVEVLYRRKLKMDRTMRWKQANPERWSEIQSRSYRKHKPARLAKQKAWVAANQERRNAYAKQYRERAKMANQ